MRLLLPIYIFHLILTLFAVVFFRFLPMSPMIENNIFNIEINFLFEFCIFASIVLFWAGGKGHWRQNKDGFTQEFGAVAKVIAITSLVGISLVFFDRLFVRGLDYSQGLRSARYDWLNSTGGGFFSVLGNILLAIPYSGLYYAIRWRNFLNVSQYLLALLFASLAILFHAMLNGGRSNVLIALSVVAFALIIKSAANEPVNSHVRKSNLIGIFELFIIGVAFIYVMMIIGESANLGDGGGMQELLQLGVSDLRGSVDPAYLLTNPSNLSMVILYMLSYLFHGQWVSQYVYNLDESVRLGYYSFTTTPAIYLESLGLINIDSDKLYFSDTGVFLTLPGSLYYDFGVFGVLIGGVLLGVSMVGAVRLALSKFSGGRIEFLYAIFAIMIFSPVSTAYGFSYFYYAMTGFFILKIISKYLFKLTVHY